MLAEPRPPARQFAKVIDIVDQHGRKPERLIPILQAVQEEYRYLPEEVLAFVATALGVPPSRVYGVATFYSHFALDPKGRYVLKLCDGTACHVKRSIPILEALRARLGLKDGRKTTPDMLFTVETVACLGACGLAPVMLVNDEVHGGLTPESAVQVLEKVLAQEEAR